MEFNSKLVKPKVKYESDKYSWNLYRAFKTVEKESKKFSSLKIKVYWYEKSDVDGSIIKFDPNKSLKPNHCFVMRIYPSGQGMSGMRISNLLRLTPKEKIASYCYDLIVEKKYLVDITDWFFNEYIKSGRCIFDREHNGLWQGDKERFTMINKHSRRCNWCGEHQRRNIKKVVNIERLEVWELQTG